MLGEWEDECATDDPLALLRDSIKVSDAVPAGEIWVQSGCSWREKQSGPHGEPEWRMAGMCVHEHLERALLCTACKEDLERWQHATLTPPGPWCEQCYTMRPGGHHCTGVMEFKRL